jgi:predicted transcriptional regulator YheO
MQSKIFLGSATESLHLVRLIEGRLKDGHTLIPWNRAQFLPGEVLIEALVRIARDVDFAIFAMTPDDQIVQREKSSFATRDNVMLEIGLFLGLLDRARVFLVYDERASPKVPSDLAGIQLVPFDPRKRKGDKTLDAICQRIRDRIAQLGRKSVALSGKRLFQHQDYYPIDLNEKREPSLNKGTFMKAVRHLIDVHDEMAATDLVYLWESNIGYIGERFTAEEQTLYEELIRSYDIRVFLDEFHDEHERIFKNYKRLVNDIGDTLQGVYFEILLHDVRNPIRSIIAARNSERISGRRVGDPSTRFVVQYVREQGRRLLEALEDQSKVCYLKQFKANKTVKATTIPIWDSKYGLVGIFCVNVDIDAVRALDSDGVKEFLDNYVHNSGTTPAFEKDIFT